MPAPIQAVPSHTIAHHSEIKLDNEIKSTLSNIFKNHKNYFEEIGSAPKYHNKIEDDAKQRDAYLDFQDNLTDAKNEIGLLKHLMTTLSGNTQPVIAHLMALNEKCQHIHDMLLHYLDEKYPFAKGFSFLQENRVTLKKFLKQFNTHTPVALPQARVLSPQRDEKPEVKQDYKSSSAPVQAAVRTTAVIASSSSSNLGLFSSALTHNATDQSLRFLPAVANK
jgi:hypothetical protein